MSRLGLWGRGTPFPDFNTFAAKIERAGVGAMELLAMDMKARGMFVSRMLAFTGCSFEVRQCVLEQSDESLYDAAVDFWEDLLQGLEKAVEIVGRDPSSLFRLYWGAHQSFFKQLLNSMKARFAIQEAEAALARGKCVVIGLLSTGEAKANEAAERETRAGRELDGEVSTPHEIARSMIDNHLPTTRYNSSTPVQGAVEIRTRLLAKLEGIRMPANALDLITCHFGVEAVAEMTGRKMRFVPAEGGGSRWEPRTSPGVSNDQINIAEKDAFLAGKKLIAIISDAASSGISLHADPRFTNVRQRLHITLELAWSADKMLQQFGRTHRSNQISAPHYVLLVSNVGGEQRFASSVARRLEMLGAITRGDRRGGHGAAADLVQYNLDTTHGHTALALMLDAIAEKADAAILWDRALRMLQCHRQGVPTLLGLAVVAVARKPPPRGNGDVASLPAGLQKYVLKLREWAKEHMGQNTRQRVPERSTYGDCPRTPYPKLTWIRTGELLQKMRLLNSRLATVLDADRYNVNKFLNRLLGLPVQSQNALFEFFSSVFRWVVFTAKSTGKLEPAIESISGESVECDGEPEVIHKEVHSLALTVHYTLKVDSGLSWDSAIAYLQETIRSSAIKSTAQGGASGFWQQTRSSRVVLAVQVSGGTGTQASRLFRVLRPNLHTSVKPQYIRFKQLSDRYRIVVSDEEAYRLWKDEYEESASSRVKEIHLLCGAILPLWPALMSTLLEAKTKAAQQLMVRRAEINGRPIIGVSLGRNAVESLKAQLKNTVGGAAAEGARVTIRDDDAAEVAQIERQHRKQLQRRERQQQKQMLALQQAQMGSTNAGASTLTPEGRASRRGGRGGASGGSKRNPKGASATAVVWDQESDDEDQDDGEQLVFSHEDARPRAQPADDVDAHDDLDLALDDNSLLEWFQ